MPGPVAGQGWTSPSAGIPFMWVEALGIWVGRYEITNAEYRRMRPDHDSGSFRGHALNGDRQPAVRINFDDAVTYAAGLNAQDQASLNGARYRLPTEAEWKIFAQCGDDREYPWGGDWPPVSGQAGNYQGQEGFDDMRRIPGYSDGHAVTAPVDVLQANPWGLHGVGGNAWEICAADGNGQTFGAWRGASWRNAYHATLRVSARHVISGTHREDDYGFRLVLSRP